MSRFTVVFGLTILLLLKNGVEAKCSCGIDSCSAESPRPDGFVNVAYNKETETSTSEDCDENPDKSCKISARSCGAVNGRTGGTMGHLGSALNCILTKTKDPASYMILRLGQYYTVYKIIIYPLTSVPDIKVTFYRMQGLSIYGDGQICYEFPPYGTPLDKILQLYPQYKANDKSIPLTCKTPIKIKVMRFQKHHKDPDNYTPLAFCEIQILVCPKGKFGSSSCKPCPQKCINWCDNHYGCLRHPQNVALFTETYTSETFDTHARSSYANDGVPWTNMKCYISPRSYGTFRSYNWFVDFAKTSQIKYILMYIHQADVKKAANIVVVIYREGKKGVNCKRINGQLREVENVTCSEAIGYKAEFTMEKLGYLRLCEVLVLGIPINEIYLGSSGCDDSIFSPCRGESICEGGTCKADVGKKCRERMIPCVTSAVCSAGVCKIPLEGDCTKYKQGCAKGTECVNYKGKYVCKKSLGEVCEKETDCVLTSDKKNVTCDFMQYCRLALDQICLGDVECGAGSLCKDSACKCLTGFQPTADQTRCNSSRTCKDTGDCNGDHVTCVRGGCKCDENYQITEKFTCELPPGSSCSGNASDCSSSQTCEDDKCRISPGYSCLKYPKLCLKTSQCDSNSKKCKLVTGQPCKTTSLCQYAATCEKGVCRVKAGSTCKNTTECLSGTFCDKGFCRVVLNGNCNDAQNEKCGQNAICDIDEKCKVDAGFTCASNDTCRNETMCSNKKCKYMLGKSCNASEKCLEGTVCDGSPKKCKREAGGPCTRNWECMTGATCTGSNKCACIPKVTTTQGKMCVLIPGVIGGMCDKSQSCNSKLAVCMGKKNGSGICRCLDGYQGDFDLQCRFAVGRFCNASQGKCVTGSVCESDNKCRLQLNEDCTDKSAVCSSTTVCDRKHRMCKLKLHLPCERDANETDCATGTVCDALGLCKYPVKEAGLCSQDNECPCGGGCDTKTGTCRCKPTLSTTYKRYCWCLAGKVAGDCTATSCTDPNASCRNSICTCNEGFSPNGVDLTCRKSQGSKCEKDSECVNGTLCDQKWSNCTVAPGRHCDPEKNECGWNAVCGEGDVCRLSLGMRCKVNDEDFCIRGAVCDTVGKCKWPVGHFCNTSKMEGFYSYCTAGATCLQFRCKCNEEVSTTNGALCTPKTGFPYGQCDPNAEKSCNSGCVCHRDTSLCMCKPGYQLNDTILACLIFKSTQGGDDKGLAWWVIVLLVVGGVALVALITVGAVMLRKDKLKKREMAKNEMDSRKTQMDELSTSVDSLSAQPLPPMSKKKSRNVKQEEDSPSSKSNKTESESQMDSSATTAESQSSYASRVDDTTMDSSEATTATVDSSATEASLASDTMSKEEVSAEREPAKERNRTKSLPLVLVPEGIERRLSRSNAPDTYSEEPEPD